MATKKPRKKKNSNVKRLTLVSRYVLKNVAIVFTLNQKATFVNINTKKIVPACQDMIVAAKDVQHQWKIYTTVMLENSLGEQYMPINECSPERACYQEDAIDALNVAHIKQINKTKLSDRVNAGWVAVPSGVELSEETVRELIEVLPCWDQFVRGEIKTKEDKKLESETLIRRLEAVA